MFPNKKEQEAMKILPAIAYQSVNKEKKQISLNDLYAEAKKNYYDWVVVEKKIEVLNDNEKAAEFYD